MRKNKTGFVNGRSAKQRTAAAVMLCVPLAGSPLGAKAEEAAATEDGAYRLAPIIVDASADAGDDSQTVVAQELWVGGKVATSILNTPASVSVVTQKEMEQRSVNTTEEALAYSPGVTADYWGTDDRNDYFQIRGFDATTYRDGLTLGSMRGVREDPFAYERIEIIRGANSTLFGPADPGGSVNFVTKQPRFNSFGQGYATYGSFDHKEVGVDMGNALNESETLAGRFTAKTQDSEREYDHSEDDNQFVMGGLTWAPTELTSATVILDYLNTESSPSSGGYPMDKEYDRDEFYGEPGYNFHDVERTSLSGNVTHDFDNGFVVRSNLRYSELTDDYGYVYVNEPDPAKRIGNSVLRDQFGVDTESHQFNGNVMLQYDHRFENIDSSSLVGVEYLDSSEKETSVYAPATPIDIKNPVYTGVKRGVAPYAINKTDAKTKALFVQQNVSFYDRFIVTGGARRDFMDLSVTDINNAKKSDNFAENSFRGALTYLVSDEVSTYVSMVESVATPDVGTTPKTGKQYEVGIKYAPAGMNALFSAAVYDLTQENITIAVVVPGVGIEQQVVGESRARGLDLEAKAEITDNLSLVGGYSYMDSEVLRGTLRDGTSIKGNQFVAAPEHSASLWTYYDVPGTNASVGLGARYVGAYYFNAANDTGESDGTTLFDAAFNYKLYKGTDLALNVSNLFDEQHVVGSGSADFYNPGREITAKVSYNW